jgi:hypothetical protein
MKVDLVLLAFAALLSYALAAPICMGYKEFPDLDSDCRARADEIACMQGYALRSANLSVSCVWHQLADAKTVDRQIVYNRAGSVVVNGVNYQGTICSTSLKVTLPSSAKGRWGAYMRMLSGPQNTSVYLDSTSPRESFVTAGCTVGRGAGDSCILKNTAPKGTALTPFFKQNAAVMEFFTTDKALIDQWNTSGRLSYNSTLKFKLEIEGTRCRDPKNYPKETPALLDEVAFGPTSYMLNENPKHYFLRTYRAYKVSNVSGIDWSVNVTKSMDKSGNKTRLTSMLMRESDYFTWASNNCTTNCTPPEDLALPHTICKGLVCTRKIRGLGATSGAYRLLVSYPELTSFISNSSFSNTAEVETRYKKQLAKVEIWPKVWSLDTVLQQQQLVTDEKGEAPAPAPAPARAPAPEKKNGSADEEDVAVDSSGEARIYMPDEADTPLFKPPIVLSWNSEA